MQGAFILRVWWKLVDTPDLGSGAERGMGVRDLLPAHMDQKNEMAEFEKEQQHNIAGWESHYGYKEKETKTWVSYQGFKIIIFNMIYETKREFKIMV